MKGKIIFHVYVGSGYVTDEIKLNIKDGDIIKQGQSIGEIVLHPNNSYADIFLPLDVISYKVGDIVYGGKIVNI